MGAKPSQAWFLQGSCGLPRASLIAPGLQNKSTIREPSWTCPIIIDIPTAKNMYKSLLSLALRSTTAPRHALSSL